MQPQTVTPLPRPRGPEEPGAVVFSPPAWLKLQFFLHAGDTEIGGFGISDPANLLYIQEFVTIRQKVTCVTVEFDDAAVADHFDAMVDRGLSPQHFARVWIHTHPGASAQPSGTDEQTFARVFGRCDWALMLILARSGQSYARLQFAAGPRAAVLLPVRVDWEAWPRWAVEHADPLREQVEGWAMEYLQNIQPPGAADLQGPRAEGMDPFEPGGLDDPENPGWEREDWLAAEAARILHAPPSAAGFLPEER